MLEEPSGKSRSSVWQDITQKLILNPLDSATNLADRLDVDFALINRNRSKGDGPESEGKMELLVGDVKDRVAILIDDMCDTGGTIKLATKALIEKGVKEVYAVVSHGKFQLFRPKYITLLMISTSQVSSRESRWLNFRNCLWSNLSYVPSRNRSTFDQSSSSSFFVERTGYQHYRSS